MVKRTPLIINLDIEPDSRQTDRVNQPPWSGFEELCRYISRLRPRLTKAMRAPVRFNWALRLDPQIELTHGSADWPIRRYRPLLEALLAEGDEIGIHPHAWRWNETDGHWVEDFANADWIDHCVRSSLRVYRSAFGRPARVSRFGSRFLSNRVIRLLDREGIACDLTLEPGYSAVKTLCPEDQTTGFIPDTTRVPRRPYRPSRFDYQRVGRLARRRLWLIPLTTGKPPAPVPYGPKPEPECLTLLLGYPFPAVRQVLDLALAAPDQPVLAAVARSDVLLKDSTRSDFEQFFDYLQEPYLRERLSLESPLEALRRIA